MKNDFSPKTKVLFFALLFLAVSVSYLPSLFNSLCYDDVDLIEKNALVQNGDFTGIFLKDLFNVTRGESPYYRPIIPAIFAAETFLWKKNWALFHLDNIVFHFIASLLLYKLVRKILSQNPAGKSASGFFQMKKQKDVKRLFLWSLSAGFFFALHPANSQTVYWLSARGDLFVAIAVLAGCLALSCDRKLSYCVMPISFFLAIFSKETGFLLLPIAAVFYLLFMRKEIPLKRALLHIVFLLPVLALYLSLRLKAVSVSPFAQVDESFWMPKDGFLKLYLTLPSIWGYYALRAVFPYFLNFETGIHLFRSVLDLQFLFGILSIAVSALSLFIFRKSRIFLWAFLVWSISLFPVLNLVPVFESGMEHYLYMPLAGMSVLSPFVFMKNRISKMVFIVVLMSFCAAVFLRGKVWKDNYSLFMDAASKTGENCRQGWIRSRSNLGTACLNRAVEGVETEDNLRKADSLYSEVIKKYPYYGGAYIGRGDVFFVSEDYEKARELYKEALEKYPSNYFLVNKLGITYSCLKEYSQAKLLFIKAVEMNGNFTDAAVNLAKIYFVEGDIDKASDLIVGLKETPGTVLLIRALKISIEACRGRIQAVGSAEEIITAIEILGEAGYLGEKKRLAESLCAASPSDSDALYNLSLIHLSDFGDMKSGYATLTEGVSRFPKDVRFMRELAVYHILTGDSIQAAYYFRMILDINPSHPEALKMREFIEKTSIR